MTMIRFDIGANTCNNTEQFAADGSRVFAFEPSILLYQNLREKFRDRPHVTVFPFAVSDSNGFATFNVSDVGDRGVGSLYDFHPNLANTVLGTAAEFSTPAYAKELVPTIRLDTFMDIWSIPEIDHLHIDAQGSDFAVIRGLGDRIKDVKAGQVECTLDIPLYSVDNYHEHVVKYLEDKGFLVEVAYIHNNRSEVDLHFTRI